MNTRMHFLTYAVAGLSLALLPSFAAADPQPAAPPPASAVADTPAVAVVRQFLAARSVGLPDAAYALLSSGSQQAISAEDFAAGPFPSWAAEITSAAGHLSTPTAGFLALLADPHQALGYTFAVIGPDPADPGVVLVRATPPAGAVKLPTVSAPETGARHAVTLRLLTVIDPKTHALRIDAVKSLEQAAAPGELDEEREQERKFVSLSHLEQLSLGIILYEKDHNSLLPDANHWADEIMPYVKDPDAFRDPSGPVGSAGEEWSYAYNRTLSRRPEAQLDYPAHTVMLFESSANTKNASDTGQSVPHPGRHLGGTDYVTADGHAQWFADGTVLSYRLDGK